MTNPNNAIGTNGAYSGRTSPEALNDVATAYSRGIISGWNCAPSTGMKVALGGTAGTRDVAIATDNSGNRETINNRSGAPVEVTISTAPASYSRIDLIVAYVNPNPTGDGTSTDNPTACGIIAVAGSPAATPVAPNDTAIRSAITTDGGTGAGAFYVILASITVGANVTTIGSGVITQGAKAKAAATSIDNSTFGIEASTAISHTASGGSYTAPSSGVAYITTAVAGGESCDVKVNNVAYVKSQQASSTFSWVTLTVLLKKGDVMTLVSSDNGGNAQFMTCIFCPFN